MKKVFALTLAVAMLLGIAAIAFAADDEYAIWKIDPANNGPRKFSSDSNWVKAATGEVISYGDTVYYDLVGETFVGGVIANRTVGAVERYEACNGVRINQSWTAGKAWVSKVELIKKKFEASGNYEYFLAVTFKSDSTNTSETAVIGKIILRDSTGNNKINRDVANPTGGGLGETNTLNVSVTLKYVDPLAVNISATGATVTDKSYRFRFADMGAENASYKFSFSKWGAATFTVSTIGQGDLILRADANYNSTIGAMYPNANLDFFNSNGITFNKTGRMFIPASLGSFIYEIKNGRPAEIIPNAVYSRTDNGFYFYTRTLGSYVVSDVNLDPMDSSDDEFAIWKIDPSNKGPRKFDSDNNWVKFTFGETINYGDTVYYEMVGETFAGGVISARTTNSVEKYEAVDGVRINQSWDIGKEWVSNVDFVKKKFEFGGDYQYFLAITFKDTSTEASTSDVVGEIVLKDSTGKNKINRDPANPTGGGTGETNTLFVNAELMYAKPAPSNISATAATLTDGSRLFKFDDDGMEDEEFEFSFSTWGAATFAVNTVGQSDLVLKADVKYNTEIGAMYPYAALSFYNGNGVTFNKTGEMFIPADAGTFIYEIKNGVPVEISDAKYDEYDEGFRFKTRTLGSYVVSDVMLDLMGSADVVAPAAPAPGAPEAVNPDTGAAA